ncbi:RNA-binding domain-containing protein [Mollisia scopiformis]|uniref:RNA-binding domain-containing protein n=1 Tax=Mollisia scopiformis TaxID=149040 RepID=A0A194WVN5_MOLSC|nr:RNA-binding domain-containing protein [Mollisia scopiformis]KUJ12025.1 RNA-binding domain-containing protein [Mollisia scopiformis]
MAKDTQMKKRKASVPEVDAEKTKIKKVKNASASTEAVKAPAKKRKATEDAAPVKVKKTKTPKPIDEPVEPEAANEESEAPTIKKLNGAKVSAKSKKAVKDVATAAKSKSTAKAPKTVKVESAKPNRKPDTVVESDDDNEEEDSDIDDQTEALLKGFESDGDEDDALNEEGLLEGESVPERKQLSKSEEKKLEKIAESGASDKPGVIYVGRIPHGFFEHEMRAYFNQFGNIIKLRISRNKKTGNSKHYGWIQFESTTVADIVARTMDNYLMFGHLLKVKLIPDEQVPANLFKGANKRFKKVPWNKMEGRKIGQGASEEVWDERIEREEQRRDEKAKKLQAIGYEFEATKVKSAKGVSKNKVAVIEPNIEAASVV